MENEAARKKVIAARSQLILEKPFWGYCATYLELKEHRNLKIKTMGTDGRNLYYDPDYVMGLSIDEMRGVVAHEVFHPAFGHIWREGDRNHEKWNHACDYAANQILVNDGFTLPAGCLLDRKFKDMSAEQIYLLLPDDCGGDGGGSGGQGTLDDHSVWGDADGKSDMDKITGNQGTGLTSGQWKENASRAYQIAKMQGQGVGAVEKLMDELINPKINYKDIIKDFVLSSFKCDYRMIPPNKRHLWRGMYLPSTYGESIEIGFALDTSGSMDDNEVRDGMSNVKACCEQFGDYIIHYWQCDYGIQLYEEVTPYNEMSMRIKGRGGTAFEPVFDDIAERGLQISALIYFTDMYGSFPKTPPTYNVLWISTHGVVEAPFGTVIDYQGNRSK